MNIGDIAEMAGVSKAAVSRYLNNGYVSAEKKARISRVIEETGYQPSQMARTLRTKKTRLIGVILPRINSDSISGIAAGIGSVLTRAGYEMLLAVTDNCPDRELEFLRLFSNRRVDGVILLGTVLTGEHRSLLSEMQIPVVLVGQKMEGVGCIFHDDYHAGYELTKYVIGRGRRKPAYIGVLEEDVAVGSERKRGFLDALAESGISPEDAAFAVADFSSSSGREKMEALLAEREDIDAVICATDSIAFGAMQGLRAHGLEIPGDVALAGFGDNVIASATTPAMTTVRFEYRRSGELAAEMILGRIGGEDVARGVCLGYSLALRQSV